MCVAGNYLLIHLKEAGEDGMNGNSTEISTINFAEGHIVSGTWYIAHFEELND